MLAPPPPATANCYAIDKALNDEYPIPKKFEAHPAYWKGSSFFVHQLEQHFYMSSPAVSSH